LKRLVVTSTAANAVGLAGKCVASVARELSRLGPEWRVKEHWFVAADEATANDARGQGAIVQHRAALAIQNCRYLWAALEPSTIVVWLDGDDELAPGALERVAALYSQPEVWLTYGSFQRSDRIVDWMWHGAFGRRYLGAPRLEVWRASHLKTFRAGLANAVPASYLEVAGLPVTHAIDHAVMVPMLELAGERYAVSTDVNCIYNVQHSAAATFPDLTRLQEHTALGWLRNLQPLDALDGPAWTWP
jgi:hypothetical protein